MIVLDTNVISALMRHVPEPNVVAWLDRQPRSSIWTTSITVLEVTLGLQIMATGKRRSALLQGFGELMEKLGRRVAPFDNVAAQRAGELMSTRHKKGKIVDLRDTMIAGVVLATNAALATRNTSHFDDISASVIDPWKA